MNKVSILMPTYNDERYICKALDSVMNQNYSNYEILICNDGSSDNTEKILKKYIKEKDKNNRIHYFYQKNADQLNAIITLMPHISGDYVYILHSDDLLYDNDTLKKMVDYMNSNKNVDSIIADVVTIDKNDNIIGINKVFEYNKSIRDTIALQLLWLGRNLYVDMAFHRKEVFIKNVYENYLLWNGPFWLNIDNNSIIKFKKVTFPFFKYRLGDNNYLNMTGSNLNVINGEIRVVTRLLEKYYIPFYKLQYVVYRGFNKFGMAKCFRVFYFNTETKNKYKILKFVLNKRFNDEEINNNNFLRSLLLFYKNNKHRKIYLNYNKNTFLYYGKDMRLFNKKINNGNIESIYKEIMLEMEKGFDEIVIKNNIKYENIVNITKFLCIYPYVKITVLNKEQEGVQNE